MPSNEDIFTLTDFTKNPEILMADSIINCPKCSESIYIRKQMSVQRARKGIIESINAPNVPLNGDSDLIQVLIEEGKTLDMLHCIKKHFANRPENEMEDFARSPEFQCPYCDAYIQILYQIAILGTVISDSELHLGPIETRQQFTELEQRQFEQWQSSGLLDLLIKAQESVSPSSVPRKIKAQFNFCKTWVSTSFPIKVPLFTVKKFQAETNAKEISFYASNGIAGIVADKYLKTFVPQAYLFGEASSKTITDEGEIKLEHQNRNRFEQNDLWVKTKYGYAVGRGIFFQSLFEQSKSSFGNATRTQRGTS